MLVKHGEKAWYRSDDGVLLGVDLSGVDGHVSAYKLRSDIAAQVRRLRRGLEQRGTSAEIERVARRLPWERVDGIILTPDDIYLKTDYLGGIKITFTFDEHRIDSCQLIPPEYINLTKIPQEFGIYRCYKVGDPEVTVSGLPYDSSVLEKYRLII